MLIELPEGNSQTCLATQEVAIVSQSISLPSVSSQQACHEGCGTVAGASGTDITHPLHLSRQSAGERRALSYRVHVGASAVRVRARGGQLELKQQ